MARTQLEKLILQQRKLATQPGILVPLLNDLLKSSLDIDSENDAGWLYDLAMKQVAREQQRKESYGRDEMVFSPSGLADCMRRVFLSKNHQKLGLERIELPAIEPHYYFFTGDFIHLKWQYAMKKLSDIHPDFMLVDCELNIASKRKDHGGTLDVICLIGAEPFAVDVKGLNVRSFNMVDRGDAMHSYRIQLADYMMLFNSALQRGKWEPPDEILLYMADHDLGAFPKIKRGILLAENKGGPDMNHPAALTEQIIDLKSNLPEVRLRLETLREHEEKEEIPEPECTSTKGIAFTGCPFAGFCFDEVKRIEIEAANSKTNSSSKLQLARPKRRSRTG